MTRTLLLSLILALPFAACAPEDTTKALPRGRQGASTPELVTIQRSITLSVDAATATVGKSLTLTAYADTATGAAVTDGTLVSFQLTGSAGLLASSAIPTKDGIAATTLSGLAPGTVTAVALVGVLKSNSVSVLFLASEIPQASSDEPAAGQIVIAEISNGKAEILLRLADEKGEPVSAVGIELYASAGTFPSSLVHTGANGGVMTTLYVSATQCPITVQARVKQNASSGGSTGGSRVGAAYILTIQYLSPFVNLIVEALSSEKLGVEGSGLAELLNFRVRLEHPDGTLSTRPRVVNFRLEPAWMAELVTDTLCCTGESVVTVHSGRAAGTVTLWAEVPELEIRRSVVFVIEGGPPTAASFNLSAQKRTLSGLLQSGMTVDFFISASDRWGNPALKSTPTFVACESGVCLSPRAGATDDFGRTKFSVEATPNERLVQSTVVHVAEFPVPFGHRWPALGSRQNGWLTVLAGAIGESSYMDLDGDGAYSVGEPTTYVPPEPFLDANENAAFDVGEVYWDYDGDNQWTDHSAQLYQARQYIWSSFTLTLSGAPALYTVPSRFLDCDGDQAYTPDVDYFAVGSGTFPCAAYPDDATSSHTDLYVYLGDLNGNPMPAATNLTVAVSGTSSVSLESNSLQTTSYDGSETAPHPPARYRLLPAGKTEAGPSPATFCAKVVVGDTKNVFTRCIDGYAY